MPFYPKITASIATTTEGIVASRGVLTFSQPTHVISIKNVSFVEAPPAFTDAVWINSYLSDFEDVNPGDYILYDRNFPVDDLRDGDKIIAQACNVFPDNEYDPSWLLLIKAGSPEHEALQGNIVGKAVFAFNPRV